jgi:hypothetical protein
VWDADIAHSMPAALGVLVWAISSSCAQPFQTSTASPTNPSNPSGFRHTRTTVPAKKVLVIEFLYDSSATVSCNVASRVR